MHVLFIGIDYYEYTQRIVRELARQGHRTTFHSMELTKRRHKVLKRYAPGRFEAAMRNYHERILASERGNHYDLVLFLQVHRMAPEIVADFRSTFPDARFVLYNWDSLRTHDYRRYTQFFDSFLTFDREDAQELGAGYLPLFALPEYFGRRQNEDARFDIYFVGTVVSADRFRAARALKRFCKTSGLRLKMHLYCSPAGLLSLLRRGLWMPELKLRSISQRQIIQLMQQSRATFDFPNHRQSGYTMRFIENLCAGLKIITSNRVVLEETFYDAARLMVLDEHLDFKDVAEFVRGPLPAPANFSSFSLASWVSRLVSSATTPQPPNRVAATVHIG